MRLLFHEDVLRVRREMGNPIQKIRASTALILDATVIAAGGCGTPESGSTIKVMMR
jgi:hypothetical protein